MNGHQYVQASPEVAREAYDRHGYDMILENHYHRIIFKALHPYNCQTVPLGILVDGEVVNLTSLGRNEICPCGSGKKVKKCCREGLREDLVSLYNAWIDRSTRERIKETFREVLTSAGYRSHNNVLVKLPAGKFFIKGDL